MEAVVFLGSKVKALPADGNHVAPQQIFSNGFLRFFLY
jgi:hypothetical protein